MDPKNEKLPYIYITAKQHKTPIEELSKIAVEEPQAALSAYTKAMCHRWTFVQRTISSIGHLFTPLENAVRTKLIPAIVGRDISDLERQIFSLPVRYGGLGIADPSTTSDREYSTSKKVTENLTRLIIQQDQSLENYESEHVTSELLKTLEAVREASFKQRAKEIMTQVDSDTAKLLLNAQEKGVGVWLTALPLTSLGYTLNKEEFRDSIRLRYGWKIPNIPAYCVCGERNDINHTLTCKTGGYVIFRHNKIRDTNAEFLREACYDVQVEPELLSIENKDFCGKGNNTDRARLDISARGLWGPFQKTMFDVRIFHPNAPSYKNKSIPELYKLHESAKIREYQHRVLQTEKASFTPLVYNTYGGMAPQSLAFHRKLAGLVAEKRNEAYNDVLNCMRTKLCFAMLRSILISIRGSRGKRRQKMETPVSCISFNLIPSTEHYETL